MDTNSENWWLLGFSFIAFKCSAFFFILKSMVVLITMSLLVNWLSPGGFAWGRTKRRSGTVPGPAGWPLIGSLMTMDGLAHVNLARLAESYGGQRLMALSLGFTRLLITSHPEIGREILNSSAFADRPVKESAYGLLFHRAIGFAPYSEYWRHLRRIAATHLFSPKRIAAMEKTRQIIADSMVRDIGNAVSSSSVGEVKVREIFRRGSLNNVFESVFGRRYNFCEKSMEAREVAWMVDEGYELLGKFNWADHLPFLGFLDLQGIRKRCSKLVPVVQNFVQKIIDDHRAVPKKSSDTSDDGDFVDVLLGLEGRQKLNDPDMVAVLWEMIFRGTDTVAILMEWILARLVLHQDVQDKLHEELDRVVGFSRRVADSDIPNLHYLQAVVKEVLRIHPPGPLLSWARLAIHDVEVGGVSIPAGTTAMVNMWAITHNKEFWNDPLDFNPERFMGDQGGEDINIMGSDLRLAPFGSGRRVCPGKALGLATVHLWLARMVHEFRWFPCSCHPVNLSEVLKLSCEMQVPLCVGAIKRSTSTPHRHALA